MAMAMRTERKLVDDMIYYCNTIMSKVCSVRTVDKNSNIIKKFDNLVVRLNEESKTATSDISYDEKNCIKKSIIILLKEFGLLCNELLTFCILNNVLHKDKEFLISLI